MDHLHLRAERSNFKCARISVEDGVHWNMKFTRPVLGSFLVALLATAAVCVAGQDQSSPPASPPAKAPAESTEPTRLTIEVTGGLKDVPIENASVYVKYVEEHAIKKDKKLELNVKTNREGVAHVAEAPLGRALVQVIADGWKPYGRWYDITDTHQVIKVRLELPPKWY